MWIMPTATSDMHYTSITNLSALDGHPLHEPLIRGQPQNDARSTNLKLLALRNS